MRTVRMVMFTMLLVLASAIVMPMARAQVVIDVNTPPACEWGYYDYAPYECVPYGYYGPEFFYNGIFIGAGPWANWGYRHGWGEHRFSGHFDRHPASGGRPSPSHEKPSHESHGSHGPASHGNPRGSSNGGGHSRGRR